MSVRLRFVGYFLCLIGLAQAWPAAAEDPARAERSWESVVDEAIAYLRQSQAPDGTFSADRSIGITGVVVTGLLQTGRIDRSDPLVARSLAAIERLVNKTDGHIAGANPTQGLKNYVTAVNAMALAAANDPGKYGEVLKDATRFLKMLQWDEGENISRSDGRFGGFGYDSKGRPDMSNTQFAIDALRAAGLKPNDEAFQKAVVFVSRSQNLKSEYQDQPWAAKINDGSFIYNPLETKADPAADGALPGYASMTYAGIKSLIYAGVDKNDIRVQTALKWIRNNYSVDENVGMPPARSKQGLYYYYHTMAKCLDALGFDELEDAMGVRHNWRQDLLKTLARRQRPDGSWVNEADRWMEGDPNLVTGFALMTLSYCKPKRN
jgi:squalene-hopene/tetraprenyl-beta-curcumene cyclase